MIWLCKTFSSLLIALTWLKHKIVSRRIVGSNPITVLFARSHSDAHFSCLKLKLAQETPIPIPINTGLALATEWVQCMVYCSCTKLMFWALALHDSEEEGLTLVDFIILLWCNFSTSFSHQHVTTVSFETKSFNLYVANSI